MHDSRRDSFFTREGQIWVVRNKENDVEVTHVSKNSRLVEASRKVHERSIIGSGRRLIRLLDPYPYDSHGTSKGNRLIGKGSLGGEPDIKGRVRRRRRSLN